jgi:dienelactone hydrolase
MFEYFPDNYTWTLATMFPLHCGGNISELDDACRPLKEVAKRNDNFAQEAWYESWKRVAERLEGLAARHEEAGQDLSAGRKYLRASLYYLTAERMLTNRDPRKLRTYTQALSTFKKGIQFRREPVEFVEVPFQKSSLPALFVPALGGSRAPCMIHFDGFDVMKETLYLIIGDDFRRRGISLLIVDHPGVGEALRLRNLHSSPDSEVPAAACVDYLERRSDVDSNRIGIMALSMGGYYAPRAAAFEKRLKCCVAWGASWDANEVLGRFFGTGHGEVASVPPFQLLWVFGKETAEEGLAFAKKYTLQGVADKITCPLLVVHGENDRQVPLFHAEKTMEAAVNSARKELKVFTLSEGGAEHCQADNMTMFVDYAADWVAKTLGGNPKGI